MQKHQWRQHGVVHFKSRPLPASGPSNNNNASQSTLNSNETVVYTPIVEQINLQEKTSCSVQPLSERIVAPVATRLPLPSVAHLLSLPVAVAKPAEVETIKLLPLSEMLYQLSEKVSINPTSASALA